MNLSILAIVFGAMLLTIAVPSSAHPNDISETEEYQQPPGDVFLDCSRNSGGVCFAVNPDAVALDLRIDDDITDPTGGFYSIRDSNGDTLARGSFCGASGEIDLAEHTGAVSVRVLVDGPIFGPLDCLGSLGIATTGSVTATWHIPAEA